MSEDILPQVPAGYKLCSRKDKCVHPDGNVLPFSEFHKNSKLKSGLNSQCKACVKNDDKRRFELHGDEIRARARERWHENADYNRAKGRESYARHAEQRREYARQYRKDHPEEVARREREYQQRNAPIIREKKRVYRLENIEAFKARDKAYATANAEKRHEYNKAAYWKNKEARNEYNRLYRIENGEAMRAREREQYAANPEKYREEVRKYRAENKGKRKIWEHNRKARKLGLPHDLTDAQWARALEYFGDCCAVCGQPKGLWHTIAMDHWIPLVSPDCTGTTATNTIPLCHSRKDAPAGTPCCNNSKQARNPEIWLRERFGDKKAKRILKRIHEYFDWVREQDGESDVNTQAA